MQRRRFLSTLFATAAGVALTARAPAAPRPRRLIQESPLAGFQYHAGERLWNDLREGDKLTLAREPGNPYDPRAVRVDWKAEKLGYLPRIENTAVSQMLDRGEHLACARIGK
jgi:hypothetical protein